MIGFLRSDQISLRATAMAVLALSIMQVSHAETISKAQNDAFYHQLMKLPQAESGYQPTRSFTIVVDTERGNQLVAEDDPNLRFNMLWMQQFKDGYRVKNGGSAFSELFRSYVKRAYKAYREQNAESMSALPDENGSIRAKDRATNIVDSMDYHLRVSDDEVRFKVEYNY